MVSGYDKSKFEANIFPCWFNTALVWFPREGLSDPKRGRASTLPVLFFPSTHGYCELPPDMLFWFSLVPQMI